MENQNTQNQKIITDPEKLKKKIKNAGTVGIIIGLSIIFLSLIMLAMNYEDASILDLSFNIILGIFYLFVGYKIKKNPTSCKKVLQVTMWVTVIYVLLVLLAYGGVGLTLLLYVWILYDSLKFFKRLEVNKNQ